MADAFDRLAGIGAIRARTLVLSGTADPLTPPKYAAFLREAIPGAQLLSFEGAGHDLPLECPAEVAAALVRLPTAPDAAEGQGISAREIVPPPAP